MIQQLQQQDKIIKNAQGNQKLKNTVFLHEQHTRLEHHVQMKQDKETEQHMERRIRAETKKKLALRSEPRTAPQNGQEKLDSSHISQAGTNYFQWKDKKSGGHSQERLPIRP